MADTVNVSSVSMELTGTAAAIMSQSPSSNKRLNCLIKATRRNKVRKIVREVYLRDDITCGVVTCETCDPELNPSILTMEDNEKILILDLNVALHQIDFLTDATFPGGVVLLTTILNEIRHQNMQTFTRLRQLSFHTQKEATPFSSSSLTTEDTTHSPLPRIRPFYIFCNEFSRWTYVQRDPHETFAARNRRAIYAATLWYKHHLGGIPGNVLLLTNDHKSKLMAINEGIEALTLYEYVDMHKEIFSLSGEKLALPPDEEMLESDDDKKETIEQRKDKTAIFPPHLSESQIKEGIQSKELFVGSLRMNKGTCYEGYVSYQGGDIQIRGMLNLNRAVDKDNVAVKLISSSEKKEDEDAFLENEGGILLDDATIVTPMRGISGQAIPSNENQILKGKIVGIIKRNWTEYYGSLKPLEDVHKSGASVHINIQRIFIPVDSRIPYITLKTRFSPELENKRLSVVIDSWDRFSKRPIGHWKAILGTIGDKDTESSLILKAHNVNTREFSISVLRCLPSADWEPDEEEIQKRLDLRKILVCSVDPPGCKDIDDALSVEILPNGNYRVGIHIADVTHFVKAGTAIDIEAAERSTTVYLVDRRTDMLPSLLTTDLCSLVAGRERLAFSALFEMTASAVIIKKEFHKTIICSSAALTYAAAQIMIDDRLDSSLLAKNLRILNNLSKILRQKRFEKGALELASAEVQFELDSETQDPMNLEVYQLRETNKMVEEFMLLANSAVAEAILKAFPSRAVLRRHPSPKNDALLSLQQLLIENGFENFIFSNSKELGNSLDKLEKPGDPLFNRIIRILTTRCMNQAVYTCSGKTEASLYFHYGLAADLYTHFTSPIRRYADILVHRLLTSLIYKSPLPAQLSNASLIEEQCDVMNIKHRNAQWAGRASVEFHSYLFLKKKGPMEIMATILSIRKNGVRIFIPKFGMEGLVRLSELKPLFDETKAQITLQAETPPSVLKAFDEILIRIAWDDREFRNATVMKYIRKIVSPKKYPLEIYQEEQKEIKKEIFSEIESSIA